MKYYAKIALQHLAMGLIIPIAVIWKMNNGLTVGEAIFTESIILLATALADLPAGFIANVINNKRSLILGALLHLVGMALLIIGDSLWIFIVAAIVTGIAWAFVSGADEAYLHDDFIDDKRKYRKYFSKVTIVDEVFTIFGMLLSSLFLYAGFDLRILFIMATAILVAHLVYTAFILPASRSATSKKSTDKKATFSIQLFKSKSLVALLPLMAALAIVFEAGRPLWQPHMQSNGIDIAAFGVLFALLKLASIAGSIVSNVRDFNIKDLLVVFTIMLGSLLLFGISVASISIIALCAYLFTENYFRIYMSTILNERIDSHRAAILSISSVIRNAIGSLIIVGTSLLADTSIMLALLCLVTLKVPAIIYILSQASFKKDSAVSA